MVLEWSKLSLDYSLLPITIHPLLNVYEFSPPEHKFILTVKK